MRNKTHYFCIITFFVLLISVLPQSQAGQGKLIATAGLMQFEGSGGGGIVPWATLAGHDSREEISINAMFTRVQLDDFRLNAYGASVSLYDKVEFSVAQHDFDVRALNTRIKQQIYGLKYRIYGDVVYSAWPQVSVGWQHKRLSDGNIAQLLGANNSSHGNDFYLAATKVDLGALWGYNTVYNLTLRATKANQVGLLGFGSIENNDYKIMAEGGVGVLLSRNLVVGVEYRQKPDNLKLGEQDWKDVFVSYIPAKNVSFTLAWSELGSIAGSEKQSGLYLSISGSFL